MRHPHAARRQDRGEALVSQGPHLTARTILRGATLIDGTGAPPIRDRAVVLENRRIAAVVPDREAGDGAVVDLGGFTLLPGLFNCHTHLCFSHGTVVPELTLVAAAVTGLEHETGRIAPGLAADLLAVEGNPAESLKALDAVRLVVADGRTVV